jgi:hypothetical protein
MKKKLRTQKLRKKAVPKKYPLRGKPVTFPEPFKPVDLDESQIPPRVPGVDKGKVIIKPDFDDPLEEFEE